MLDLNSNSPYIIAKWLDIANIADALREKTNTTEQFSLYKMADKLNEITTIDSPGTCHIVLNLPAYVTVFYSGISNVYYNGTLTATHSAPSNEPLTHCVSIPVTREIPHVPIGSILVFYYPQPIQGATVEGDIEFSLTNYGLAETTDYTYAIAKCNGSGTITINV